METTDIDHDQILDTFLAETEEQLAEMEEALVVLESQPEDAEALHGIFRVAHTLKGNAASMGLASVAEVAHVVEDLLDRLRVHAVAVSDPIITLLLRAVDVIRGLVPEALSGREEASRSHDPFLRELAAACNAVTPAASAVPTVEELSAEGSVPGPGRRTLRVDIGRLDRLLDLTGEIAVARGRLAQLLHLAGGEASGTLLEVHREADRIFMDLQGEVLRSRMVPLGPTFRQQVRTVRDAARTSGKLARLVVEGEDVEVDTTLVEQIRGPITHMVRNALDHGIETPARRTEQGKDPRGKITLRARHESGGVVIELCDDGAGFDRDRIAAQALRRGLIASAEALSDEEVLRLVFEPGFSTSETVTELSGRGIGMDVVRRNVEALRGSVNVRSVPGAGTTFTIRLPLTVAIIQGFLVQAGGETYVIPLEAVLECLDFPGAEAAGVSGVINLRGEAVPYLGLREAFGLPGSLPHRESLVVVTHENRRAALAVDALLGESQIVIKSFGRLLKHVPGVAGSTILGSGRVALILDVPELMKSAKRAAARAGEDARNPLSGALPPREEDRRTQ